MSRIANVTKLVFTISDQMARLAKEDERSQAQILELGRMMYALGKDVATIGGQLAGIEKRLEDREKMLEATLALRVRDEVERALAAASGRRE